MSERKWRILFQISFVLIACLAIEGVLRFSGYPPGDLRPNWLWFRPVDSLYVIHDFYTNHRGILVADSDYWNQQGIHINSDGFRGKEFSELDSTKKKVLFIGDSFTWGMSASPFQDSSFCDILGRETPYQIINTGIPAADPAQYNQIATVYVPRLKPDYVFVVFFMGNDLMKEDRRVLPDTPFYYWTNAGAILADIDGRHFESPQAAYNYLANEKYFLKSPTRWYEKVISKSSLLSRLYAARFRVEEKISYETLRKNTSVTKRYLKNIVNTCAGLQIPVKFILIPESKEADMTTENYDKKYQDILEDKELKTLWLFPNPQKSYFKPNPDGHLNNMGHRVYAKYIETYLQQHLLQ